MVGLNVGQAQVKFFQVWSQVFPVYLQHPSERFPGFK